MDNSEELLKIIFPETAITIRDKVMSYGFTKKEANVIIFFLHIISSALWYIKSGLPLEHENLKNLEIKFSNAPFALNNWYCRYNILASEVGYRMMSSPKQGIIFTKKYLEDIAEFFAIPKRLLHMCSILTKCNVNNLSSPCYDDYIHPSIKKYVNTTQYYHKLIKKIKMWLVEANNAILFRELEVFGLSKINLYYVRLVVTLLAFIYEKKRYPSLSEYYTYKLNEYVLYAVYIPSSLSEYYKGKLSKYAVKSFLDHLIYDVKKLKVIKEYNKCECGRKGLFIKDNKLLCIDCYRAKLDEVEVFVNFIYPKNIYMIISEKDYNKLTDMDSFISENKSIEN